MRRVIAIVVALSVIGFAGSSWAVKAPGPPQLPAVQATVKDLCTGKPITAFTARAVDAQGGIFLPAVQKRGKFTIATIDAPAFTLQVSAPGYVAIGDPADPNPGVGLEAQPGPIQQPGAVYAAEGLNVAIALQPDAPCARPKLPSVPTLSGMLADIDSGQPLAVQSVTADVLGGTGPNGSADCPVAPSFIVTNGSFRAASAFGAPGLAPCVYAVTVQGNGGSTPPVGVLEQWPLSSPSKVAIGTVVDIAMSTRNHAPKVTQFFVLLSGVQVNQADFIGIVATDADLDPLTYQWNATDPSCSFDTPTQSSVNVKCQKQGSVVISVDVSDGQLTTTWKTNVFVF